MSKLLGAIALGVALITPAAVQAQNPRGDQDQRDARERRGDQQEHHPYAYYDAKHRDWHTWNNDEDKSYHQYLNETHKQDQDFSRASEKDQQDYWKWRHKHSESH